MPIVFVHGPDRDVIEVTDFQSGATVGDLAAALCPGHTLGDPTRLTCAVDGIAAPPTTHLDEWIVCCGAQVTVVPNDPLAEGLVADGLGPGSHRAGDGGALRTSHAPSVPDVMSTELHVVGGLDAGAIVHMVDGSATVGCAEDPTVSTRHCTFTVVPPRASAAPTSTATPSAEVCLAVTDHGSTNGTWIAGRQIIGPEVVSPGTSIRLGATIIEVQQGAPRDQVVLPPPVSHGGARRPGNWKRSYNRPPRVPGPAMPRPVAIPVAPDGTGNTARLGVVALGAPLIVGLVMVLALHNLIWGLFALLGPAMMLAGWFDQRRANSRLRRGALRRFEADLATFAAALGHSLIAERDRRRAVAPSLVELARRATEPSARLWERRPGDADWMHLRIATGDVSWSPPLDCDERGNDPDDQVKACHQANSLLVDTPVEVRLHAGCIVGIVGPRTVSRRVARALLAQSAVHHGPADLALSVLTDRLTDWTWARWLPHVMAESGSSWVAGTSSHDDVVGQLAEADGRTTCLVIVDDPARLSGRRSPTRRLLSAASDHIAAVVLVDRPDQLPASCTTIIELTDDHGSALLSGRHVDEPIGNLHLEGTSTALAEQIARSLARLDDPESVTDSGILPSRCSLLELLDLERISAANVLAIWDGPEADPPLRTIIGISGEGPVEVDLVSDGPHLLVAGTTGAGKSEFLRTLVGGLAASASPDHVAFLLIDFKGGSAFDCLADLPHTVGLVTDLSPEETQRTLRCLEAELKTRERRLRRYGAGDLVEYRTGMSMNDGRIPIPRLVVVIDEFATLARELPGVLDSLVSIAQRGRSLGVHLVLATQRPAGSVSDQIRANVALRVALRLQDTSDSIDVIDRPDAARLPRDVPGRAIIRFGPDECFTVQVASASESAPQGPRPRVTLTLAEDEPARDRRMRGQMTTPNPISDLTSLVAAVCGAHDASGRPSPRAVCPPPLPVELSLDRLETSRSTRLEVAMADLPDSQSQEATGWDLTAGPLVLIGVTGSGTSTTLASLALAAAHRDPAVMHVYVVDGSGHGLAPLARLPHTGAVVGAVEHERQFRLVRQLFRELERRRAVVTTDGDPTIVVLIDELAPLLARWADPLDGFLDELGALVCEGSSLGIHVAFACDRMSAVPRAWQSSCVQRWLFRIADLGELADAGPELADPARPSGRMLMAPDALTAQVARVPGSLHVAVEGRLAQRPEPRTAPPVGVLPHDVGLATISGHYGHDGQVWCAPVGIGNDDFTPVGWRFRDGDHAVITGPARSGRSSVLYALADLVAEGSSKLDRDGETGKLGRAGAKFPPHRIVTVSPRSALAAPVAWRHALVSPRDVVESCRDALAHDQAVLLLIDDADRLPDDGHGLAELLEQHPTDLVVVAALSNEAARSRYSHFSRKLSASRMGLLLQPDIDIDGELFGVRLPRRSSVAMLAGRGYLVTDGHAQIVQCAHVGDASPYTV